MALPQEGDLNWAGPLNNFVTDTRNRLPVTRFLAADMVVSDSDVVPVSGVGFSVGVGTYQIRWVLSYHSDGTSTARIRIGVDGPSSSRLRWTASHTFGSGSVNKSNDSFGTYFGDAPDASPRPLYLDVLVTTTSSGTVVPQYGSPDGFPITVTAGSFGEMRPVV